MVSYLDVESHNTRTSCWVVISGKVYDVTELVDEHPGGSGAILRNAGRDATKEYEPVHAAGTLEKHLPRDKHLGAVTGLPSIPDTPPPGPNNSTALPLSACMSLDDLELAGRAKLTPAAAAYFTSGAETKTAFERNRADWGRIGLRPRVLRDVTKTSMRCQIMGSSSSMPIFIAPAAAARLGHEDGENCLARGAARMDIPQCVCTYSSVPLPEVVETFTKDPLRRGGALFFQLYAPKVKKDAEKLIIQAKKLGFTALVVTVDSAVIGKRDDDDRFKALNGNIVTPDAATLPPLPGQEAETLRGVHCSNLVWDDLAWIRSLWGDRPIMLKGVQTAEDALEATKYPVDGIYLSNHGGRQLDFAPSSIKTLLDIGLRYPEVLRKLEVYVDGGVTRGTDVVKALCLGARGVGIGRPFIYAMSAYGDAGVVKAIQIMSDEVQTAMRLLGVTDLSQLNESYVDISDFQGHSLRRTQAPQAKM